MNDIPREGAFDYICRRLDEVTAERDALRDVVEAQDAYHYGEHEGECYGHHTSRSKLCQGCDDNYTTLTNALDRARAVSGRETQ